MQPQKFEEFEGEYKMINGKPVLVIKPRVETIVHPDGRKDVIIHAPKLGMKQQIKEVKKVITKDEPKPVQANDNKQ